VPPRLSWRPRNEGAPSLRILQGWVRCCRQDCFVFATRFAYVFVVPALRKVGEGRGTHCVVGAGVTKSLGPAANTGGSAVWYQKSESPPLPLEGREDFGHCGRGKDGAPAVDPLLANSRFLLSRFARASE
jgi:hypothetical protein